MCGDGLHQRAGQQLGEGAAHATWRRRGKPGFSAGAHARHGWFAALQADAAFFNGGTIRSDMVRARLSWLDSFAVKGHGSTLQATPALRPLLAG